MKTVVLIQGNLPLVNMAITDANGAPVDLTGCTVQVFNGGVGVARSVNLLVEGF